MNSIWETNWEKKFFLNIAKLFEVNVDVVTQTVIFKLKKHTHTCKAQIVKRHLLHYNAWSRNAILVNTFVMVSNVNPLKSLFDRFLPILQSERAVLISPVGFQFFAICSFRLPLYGIDRIRYNQVSFSYNIDVRLNIYKLLPNSAHALLSILSMFVSTSQYKCLYYNPKTAKKFLYRSIYR